MQRSDVDRRDALTPETVLGRYVILGFLGRGSMGEVYRASDPRLGRLVAIKVLPSDRETSADAQRRFETEIRAVAALNHKGICTVYDVGHHDGRPFLVMELLNGETLEAHLRRKRLAFSRILDVSIQLADALTCAHEHGIIHRDIKSGNIFLTERGDAKIVDFGIAKFGSLRQTGTDPGGLPTDPGLAVGTLAYMAPEQMWGDVVDHRSDLYSLGVVLYELATGALPHATSTVPSLVELFGPDSAPSLRVRNRDVPEAFDLIVRRALEKDPGLRFQTASDLLATLRALRRDLATTPSTPTGSGRNISVAPTARRIPKTPLLIAALVVIVGLFIVPRARERLLPNASLASIASIAVLPCRAPSDELELAYQCRVIREDLVASLSGIPGLRVKPAEQNWSAQQNADPIASGRQLDVDAILTLDVEPREANGKRTFDVPVQVLRVHEGGAYVWGKRYSGVSWDSLHETIGRDVQANLRLRLSQSDAQRLEIERTLQTARYYWDQRSDSSLRRAIGLYQRVIAQHDTIARAYAGLAKAYVLLSYYGGQSPAESYDKAKTAARRALALDPGLADAHAAVGLAARDYDREWTAAQLELSRAIELDSTDATARQWYAELMTMTGRFDAAEESIVKAVQLAPVQLTPRAVHGWILLCAGKLERAEQQLRQTLDLKPDYYLTNWFLGETLAEKGNVAAAIDALRKAVAVSSGAPRALADLASVYARNGQRDSATAILQRLLAAARRGEQVSRYEIAIARTGLGDADGAMRDLEAALNERTWQAANIMIDPMLRPLRRHPKFAPLVRKAGLSPYW